MDLSELDEGDMKDHLLLFHLLKFGRDMMKDDPDEIFESFKETYMFLLENEYIDGVGVYIDITLNYLYTKGEKKVSHKLKHKIGRASCRERVSSPV